MKNIRKRLYRDNSYRLLGGVCSGLSFYFSVDRGYVRLIFFLSSIFFLVTIPLYVICWAVIPKARTNIERSEMKGEDSVTQDCVEKKETKTKQNKNNRSNSIPISSSLKKIVLTMILFFCSLILFVIFGLSLSFPFMIELFRDFSFMPDFKQFLIGILVGEKAFTINSISTILLMTLPFVAGGMFSLCRLQKFAVKRSFYNYVGLAWVTSLAITCLV